MNLQAVHAPVHPPDTVRAIIAEALAITAEQECEGHLERAVFEQACQMLGARASTFVQPQQVALDPRLLTPSNGRG